MAGLRNIQCLCTGPEPDRKEVTLTIRASTVDQFLQGLRNNLGLPDAEFEIRDPHMNAWFTPTNFDVHIEDSVTVRVVNTLPPLRGPHSSYYEEVIGGLHARLYSTPQVPTGPLWTQGICKQAGPGGWYFGLESDDESDDEAGRPGGWYYYRTQRLAPPKSIRLEGEGGYGESRQQGSNNRRPRYRQVGQSVIYWSGALWRINDEDLVNVWDYSVQSTDELEVPTLRHSTAEDNNANCYDVVPHQHVRSKHQSRPVHWFPLLRTVPRPDAPFQLVPVPTKYLELFQNLLQVRGTLGGRDQREPGVYRRLELVGVFQVQNRMMSAKYQLEKEEMKETNLRLQREFGLLPRTVELKEPMSNLKRIHPGSFDSTVGEVLLLAGVPHEDVARILGGGWNQNLAGSGRGHAHGRGIYAAEDIEKADQYATSGELPEWIPLPHGVDRQGVFTVIISRVLLGYLLRTRDGIVDLDDNREIFVGGRAGPRTELRMIDPPATINSKLPELSAWEMRRPHYQSLVVERVDQWGNPRYREFMQPKEDRLCPEFVLAYRRRP